MDAEGHIIIRGAKVNNLKDITVEIPRGKLVVITGISGSGKSSLAFDTLFAEGQRRFAESLSSYARQFLGRMTKPDVESIEGIPPAIAIEQKVNVRNPRSTVATTTEIYDYLRIIFARIGRTYSPVSGREVRCNTLSDVVDCLLGPAAPVGTAYLLADLDWDNRTDKVELMLSLKEEGYTRLMGPSGPLRIEEVMQRAETGDYPAGVCLLIDRVRVPEVREGQEWDDLRARVLASVADAYSRGNGKVYVQREGETDRYTFVNRMEMDGMAFKQPDEYLFSFNSPLGACPVCGGLGKIIGVSEDLVVPDKSKSLYDGAIACWRGEKMSWFRDHMIRLAPKYGIRPFEPYCNLTQQERDTIWNAHSVPGDDDSLVGIAEFFEWVESNRYKIQYKYMLSRFSGRTTCHACHGTRLRAEALYVKVGGRNLGELLDMNVDELLAFFSSVSLTDAERTIAGNVVPDPQPALQHAFRRGKPADQSGDGPGKFPGGIALYPGRTQHWPASAGHRPPDRGAPAAARYRQHRGGGGTRRGDDAGGRPADRHGTESGCRRGPCGLPRKPAERGAGVEGIPYPAISYGCTAAFRPPASRVELCHQDRRCHGAQPQGYRRSVPPGGADGGKRRERQREIVPGGGYPLSGPPAQAGRNRVEYVDQSPIGKSSRSNAVTYLKVYDSIRKLLSDQPYARMNGYTPSFFSFNQDGGRCPECQGEGVVHIGMQFMADVTMVCEACGGKRFKSDILEVRYKGKNIDDILDMSVEEAIAFFGSQEEAAAREVAARLQPLVDVGLSYIKLGQSSSTLSGGESQRIKLAYFLAMSGEEGSRRGNILFLFDEPTTGLHFYDVEKLLKAFDVLLAKGHTVVVVEHNLDVIRNADWILDLGPDAGDRGGELVFAGTPEELAARGNTFTAEYLKPCMQ